MKVGFIGLGRMGKGMARRILDGGHDLAVYDVVRIHVGANGLGPLGFTNFQQHQRSWFICGTISTRLLSDHHPLRVLDAVGGPCALQPGGRWV